MHLLELTLPTPPLNLALDEALLVEAERTANTAGILRIWQSETPMVVVGRASRLTEEVNLEQCRARRIPVLRRTSGGAAVVCGPGCLMYAVVLSYERYPQLQALDQCHRFVMETMQGALAQELPDVRFDGTCDLTWQGRKFSGNSLRCKKTHVLYHGTLLYAFNLSLVELLLRVPPRMPEYRRRRKHAEFVTNIPVSQTKLRQLIAQAWQAELPQIDWPREDTKRLAAEKYGDPAWNAMR